jgi:hypothetical protein
MADGSRYRKRCAILLFFCSIGCALAQAHSKSEGPAALELKRLVAADPEFKRLLVTSIEQAKQANPD